MSCCAENACVFPDEGPPLESWAEQEMLLASRVVSDGVRQVTISVPGMHCGACIRSVEGALSVLPGIDAARVNLSTRRVSVRWRGERPPAIIRTLAQTGYEAHLEDTGPDERDPRFDELLRSLAVAGFAAMNVMLLSVSVWTGADAATRDLFHWISAAIAFPALLYSGRMFFRPAWKAVRHGHTNMDVPISIGVLLAYGLSLYETIHRGEHAYFDASVTLLFVLLIGRTLDHLVRQRARSAVSGLARLGARGAMILRADGSRDYLPTDEIEQGMRILLAPGERVPVDARIEDGTSDIDCSLVTGEGDPRQVAAGAELLSGTLNLTAPLTIIATATARDSFLCEMMRLVETAENAHPAPVSIADKAAGLYAPVVHAAAALALLGWLIASGDLHQAVTVAVAVLIITCPCALGLAVPMVQVAAARRLFEGGVMVKDGAAVEQLLGVDVVVLDKTGTLTENCRLIDDASATDLAHLALAAGIAANSAHPQSRALAARKRPDDPPLVFESVEEHPGLGVQAIKGHSVYRLGRAEWALRDGQSCGQGGTVLSQNGILLQVFRFSDGIRPGAAQAVADLRKMGLSVEVISGDRQDLVRQTSRAVGIDRFEGEAMPARKLARLAELAKSGHKVLMVGDGLNDAPALAAADVSMAPADAADIGRSAAGFVFLHRSLEAVPHAIALSRRAGTLIRQNLAFAVGYNAVAFPFAALGHVTPLIAALAMSGSSLLVVANSLRLGRYRFCSATVEGERQVRRSRRTVQAMS